MEPAPIAVRIADIHRTFGSVRAVSGVSIDVRQGEFLALLGPSGSGKTTVLRIIAGFETPSSGTIHIAGRPMDGVPPERRDIGVVFQHLALFPHLTVFRNVAFGLEMRRVDGASIRNRVKEALDMVRLDGFADRMPNQLSGGQQQRVALARALVTRPSVLLLDEPLASLDPHLRGEMQIEIRQLQKAVGITTVMVTHDQEEAMTMGDRIAVMHEGTLRQLATPQEIYEAPASAFIAHFIGAANVFEIADMTEAPGGLALTTRTGETLVAATKAVDSRKPLSAVIRPETIQVSAEPPSLANRLRGRVAWSVYVGDHTRCRVSIEGGAEFNVVLPKGHPMLPLAVGDAIWIGWPAAATLVVPDVQG